MFRLHKSKHAKSGERERIDFNFSQFKALQVPKGWEKLLVSIISVETGKTIAKSSKVPVRNGSCQWTDTLSESIWVSQDDSSKEFQDCFFKLLVSMGSSRSGILGEATVNMTGYMNSSASLPVTLPLKKCTYGTILQVQIHCLTPRTKLRGEESKETNSHIEDQKANYDMDTKSDGSESIYARSLGSSSSKDLGSTSHPGEPGSRETSFSASGSHHSYDSTEGSIGRGNFSPGGNLDIDGNSLIGRQDSTSSQNSVPRGNYPVADLSQSNHSSFNSCVSGSGNHSQNNWQEFATSSLKLNGSSKNLKEAAQDTTEELRAEAKMWERNARKLMIDLDILRKEFSDQSKNQANLNMELSAACAERDGLKKEVEQLKLSIERPMVKQTAMEDLTFQDEGVSDIQKELKDELKYQKESNANLSLQFQRSQESNIELVSVLQELEETIEKQKIEIENLSAPQTKFSDMENSIQVNIEENRNLILQPQQSQESEKNLKIKVQSLEQAVKEKNHHTENEGNLNNQSLLEIETEYISKLSAKEEEITSLKAKLSELRESYSAEMESMNESDANLVRDIEALKEKVQELERDCNELTDENLELLFKLKEASKISTVGSASFDFSASELLNKSSTSFESEVSEFQIHYLEDNLKKSKLREIENSDDLSTKEFEGLKMELEGKVTELGKELTEKTSEIAKLKANLKSKEEQIGVLGKCQSKLEAKVSNLQKEKTQLEEQMEVVQRESDITSKCLNDLQNDLMALSSSVDSHVSANKILERKSLELENGKCELELHISELEQENVQLSVHVSDLEDQLRYLTDERESNQVELEDSKSYAGSLLEEISRLRTEIDSEKADLKEKLQDMQNRWSEAQQECEYQRRENEKLQATAESLIEECSTIQKSNGESRKQNLELHEHCSLLEVKLRESERNFADCSKRVEILEENLSSVLEEIALREKSLTSELDALLDENTKQKEKLILGESFLNQMYMEKTVEVENLLQEVECLTKQLSANYEEKERIASDAVHDLSSLRADKAKLESDFQEAQSKVKLIENELNITQMESDSKLQSLMVELAASKENQEMLKADHEEVLKLLENYKSDEAEFITTVNALELKLTVFEYERQKLVEESKDLKVQLQNIAHLQDEVLAYKNELDAAKFEKEKLEASMHSISNECEDLKAENNSFVAKISTLQKTVSELEDCRRNRVILEEKLLQVEEANRQYQKKTQLLKEEKDQSVAKAQALGEELKLKKEEKQIQRDSSTTKNPSFSKTGTKVSPVHQDTRPSKHTEMVKSTSPHRDNKRKQSLKKAQELVKDQQNLYSNEQKREDGNGYGIPDGSALASGVNPVSKIQLLEKELANAMEANNIYKAQLDRLLSEGQNSQAHTPTKSTAEDEVEAKERCDRKKSSLEAELIDIRERYLNMSLKYAEVESEREELVMKLKATKDLNRCSSMNS